MKLLLDQNVSRRLLQDLSRKFPGSNQVALLEMGDADDLTIWNYAKREGFAIVTHDSDFEALGLLAKGPPLVVWLRCGNQPRLVILDKLLRHQNVIESAFKDPEIWCVEIY